MSKFQPGNQLARRNYWSASRIRAFQMRLRKFQTVNKLSNEELADSLDYGIKYLRIMRGDYKTDVRQPSREFQARFTELQRSAPKPKTEYRLPVRDRIVVNRTLIDFLTATCAKLVRANARLRKK